jgi:hypothetical protein
MCNDILGGFSFGSGPMCAGLQQDGVSKEAAMKYLVNMQNALANEKLAPYMQQISQNFDWNDWNLRIEARKWTRLEF